MPEHAEDCLTCACANQENKATQRLFELTDARSGVGVFAAAFVANPDEFHNIVLMTRAAIAEERHFCNERRKRNSRPVECKHRR